MRCHVNTFARRARSIFRVGAGSQIIGMVQPQTLPKHAKTKSPNHVPGIILSSHYITSYRISPYLMSCQTLSHQIVSCPIVAHAILPSPVIPHHIIPFHLMSYRIDTCINIFQRPLGQAEKSNATGWIRRALQRHGEIL